jgi:hypothetical protein
MIRLCCFFMGFRMCFCHFHSRDGQMLAQLAPACHKNGKIQVQTSEKSDSACQQETLYTMPAALWKLHHPVFYGGAAFFC